MQCEKLDVWKSDYGFKDQISRSGLSIPSNIAEGMERFSKKEKIRFLDMARASCAELITQIYIGIKTGLVNKEKGLENKREIEEIAKMITSLIKGLNNAR